MFRQPGTDEVSAISDVRLRQCNLSSYVSKPYLIPLIAGKSPDHLMYNEKMALKAGENPSYR